MRISSGWEKRAGEWEGSPQYVSSPDPAYAILIEDFLVADYEQLFNLSLRDQHPVKWIPVRSWQHPGADSVVARHGQAQKVFPVNISTEVLHEIEGGRQPSKSELRGNLPSGNSANKNAAIRLSNQFSARLGQCRIVAVPPKQGMRVQQEAHAIAPRRQALPLATARRTPVRPSAFRVGLRAYDDPSCPQSRPSGTVFPRAITISSPRQGLLINRESSVLALCMVMVSINTC